MENKIAVYLIEDHPAIIAGIKGYLEAVADNRFEIMGVASTATDAQTFLEFTAPTFQGIIVLDIGMGDQQMYGYDFAKRLKENATAEIGIVVYSMRNEIEVIRKMIEAGVSGYVDKNANMDELYQGMMQVADGENYYSKGSISKAVTYIIKNPKTDQDLTPTELEIIKLMRNGLLTYKEIATDLHRSPRTVEQHLQHLYNKSGTNNMASLLHWILKNEIGG